MKHIIFYVLTACCACIIAYIIMHNTEEKHPKLLTIDTTYSYIYDDQQTIEIIFYINHKKHPLNDIRAYDYLYLANEDETKRIEVELKSVSKGHFESYLGETYQQIILQVKCPYVDGYYEIEHVFLKINLVNQQNYMIRLGDLFIHQKESPDQYLVWQSLYGMKSENQFVSRLAEIHVPYETLEKPISSVSIGTNDLITFQLEDNILKITILYQEKLLFQVPVILTFDDESIQIIDNFRYIIDYQLLKESGPLVNIYALN